MKHLKSHATVKYFPLALVSLLVAVFGIKVALLSHAATVGSAFEAESGVLSGNASRVNVSSASGGVAINFGSPQPGFAAGVVDNCSAISSASCSSAGYTQQAQIWHTAGITSVRTWLGCNIDATTRWNKDLKYYVAQGVQPILVVDCGRTYADVQAKGFATWFGGFVSTMGSFGVHNYEFGNEMNGNTQWHTTSTTDTLCGSNQAQATDYATHVQDYVDWLQAGFTLAHANDPHANVISGGVEYSNTWQYCIVPSNTWITQMVKDGADRYMDGFGYHPYSAGRQTPASAVAASLRYVNADNYDTIKSQLGISDTVPKRPMWITEIGYCLSSLTCSSNGVIVTSSDIDRANLIKTLFDGLKAAGVAEPVDWYWDAGDGYGLETGGTAQGCTFGATTMTAYTGHVLTPTLCAIKAYQNP